ncbi:MAG: NTP transferase domain-containing protein [Elusimicrobia bacterium]|nr:NTP transferase domain-containing protein [Elusimicrobiota bacterium]
MKAVVLAGGKGTRLAPYTTVFPKPLMPLGEKPILEIVLRQLKSQGFKEVILAVGHFSELIRAYFGNGESLGIEINYSEEETPLGTAGPLSSIDGLKKTFLVMNGDILSSISFSKLIDFHKKNKAIATIAVNRRCHKVDYGVIKVEKGGVVRDYIEKPELDYDVSMGIYIFEETVLKYIPKSKHLDFPDLIKELLKEGHKVSAYKSDDYWLDIGRHDDYEKAQKEFEDIKGKILNVK